ncbi:MAG: flagellar basal body rod protein FlgB [Nitrospinota bacterium]|nr:flagellar basal body rod protein FlgB [Nitrospinota bacterium]
MLIDKLLFSDKIPLLLKKNLNFQSERNLLISSNTSNINTPGYKAQDLNFQTQLDEILDSDDQLKISATDNKHFGPSKDALKNLEPEVFEEEDAARSNGNNVNLDKEMLKLAENQITYTATVQLMSKRASTIRAAITENAT